MSEKSAVYLTIMENYQNNLWTRTANKTLKFSPYQRNLSLTFHFITAFWGSGDQTVCLLSLNTHLWNFPVFDIFKNMGSYHMIVNCFSFFSCIWLIVTFHVRMEGDICVGEWAIKGKYGKLTSNIYGVFEFVVHYLVHMVALIYFYWKVIRESKKMLQKQEHTTSANTQKVSEVTWYFKYLDFKQYQKSFTGSENSKYCPQKDWHVDRVKKVCIQLYFHLISWGLYILHVTLTMCGGLCRSNCNCLHYLHFQPICRTH